MWWKELRQWMDASRCYHLITRWLVPGRVEDVAVVLRDPRRFPEWWGEVVLAAEVCDEDTVAFRTRGFLPYRLRFEATPTDDHGPSGFDIAVKGDFEGMGRWRLAQRGAWVEVRLDWQVRVAKPLLRRWSFLCKPLFAANHRWAMRRGGSGLATELVRRQSVESMASELECGGSHAPTRNLPACDRWMNLFPTA